MDKTFSLIFDEVILKQLKHEAKNNQVKEILSKMFDKMELAGPLAGKLIDSKLFLYELKNKHPPIRLYFKHNKDNDEIYVFEFEMKTSPEKQEKTIEKLKHKVKSET